MHEGGLGYHMWEEALTLSIEVRKEILKKCHYIKPFVPPTVHQKTWEKESLQK